MGRSLPGEVALTPYLLESVNHIKVITGKRDYRSSKRRVLKKA